MAKFERSRIPLYVSAVLVFVGVAVHTVGAVLNTVNMAKCNECLPRSYIMASFAVDWLSRWIFKCIDHPLWALPTVALLFQAVWLLNYLIKRRLNKKYAEPVQEYKQKNISFVLFLLSFVPIVLIFLFSVYSMFAGFREEHFMGGYSMCYGTEAFVQAMFLTCILFTVLLPVLPFMLVWQIVYLVRKFRK